MNCQGSFGGQACYGDVVLWGVATSVKADYLLCGENGCGGQNFTFIDSSTGKNMKVSDKVVKKYSQSCSRKRCKGIFSCFGYGFLTCSSN